MCGVLGRGEGGRERRGREGAIIHRFRDGFVNLKRTTVVWIVFWAVLRSNN